MNGGNHMLFVTSIKENLKDGLISDIINYCKPLNQKLVVRYSLSSK